VPASAGRAATIDREAVRRASPLERIIPGLLGEHAIEVGAELKVRCPWHEDKRPSLRIDPAKQTWYCDPCHTGGDVFRFVERHQGLDFPAALRFLAERAGMTPDPPAGTNGHGLGRIVAEYSYRDEAGVARYQSVRFDPKDFRQRRPDGKGGWIWNLKDVRRVLYRLPELQGREAVVLVEGEKDVHAIEAVGLPATCNVGGAGKWREDDTAQLVAAGAKRVRIIPDNDRVGRDHAEAIARSCHAAGLDVRIVPLPDVPDKGDVSDFLGTHSSDDLRALLKAAPPYVPTAVPTGDDGDDLEADPALPTHAWPASLSRAAYLGIFGDIVDALAPETEADPAALLIQMLAMFGNVIGRTAHFRVEADVHYLNLFVGLVGESAKGRKGVSTGHAARLFRTVDDLWMTDRHSSGLSTGEGLIFVVRDPLEKKVPVKEKNRPTGEYDTVIEDHGVADKRLFVNEAELASTLKVMVREGNTLSPVIRNAWDGTTLRTMTRNCPLKATDPHVSLVGSIVRDELRRHLDATESANGFANRFLWICVRRAQYLPDGGAPVRIDALVARLRALVAQARETGELKRDAATRALWHQVYRPLSAGRPGLLGSITARAEAQVMRLACLYALGDGARCVGVAHLRAALEVWRYAYDSAGYIFGEALGDPKADMLLAALKAASTAGLSRWDITRDVFRGNVAGRDLSRVLALLQDAELVTSSKLDTAERGRPTERWFYRPRPYEENEVSRPEGNYFVSFVASSLSAESLAGTNGERRGGLVPQTPTAVPLFPPPPVDPVTRPPVAAQSDDPDVERFDL
jgi:hypothetical protein